MIVVLTRIWPTPGRPSLGTFVRDRVRGIRGVRVVGPRRMGLPLPLRYVAMLIDALRVRGPVRGVEAHVVLPTGLVGLTVARLRRVPLVIYAHGGDVRDGLVGSLPIRWLTRLTVRGADRVVTNSEETARELRAMGVEPAVAPPGVDLARFAVTPRPGERRVLYLGGRNPRKGYEVARELADTLVGPWLRDIDPTEIPALIAAHDVVLVPSRAEPFGIVAVEAIAAGRWVVAAATGGLREIVVDGVNGTLVSDGDYRSAVRTVPEYDPEVVAATAARYSLVNWQRALAGIWEELIGPAPLLHPTEPGAPESGSSH